MKGFHVFVDFALSAGNQMTTLCLESTGVASGKKIGCQTLSQPFLWDVFHKWLTIGCLEFKSLVLYW
jgi:hypothetical protein